MLLREKEVSLGWGVGGGGGEEGDLLMTFVPSPISRHKKRLKESMEYFLVIMR